MMHKTEDPTFVIHRDLEFCLVNIFQWRFFFFPKFNQKQISKDKNSWLKIISRWSSEFSHINVWFHCHLCDIGSIFHIVLFLFHFLEIQTKWHTQISLHTLKSFLKPLVVDTSLLQISGQSTQTMIRLSGYTLQYLYTL